MSRRHLAIFLVLVGALALSKIVAAQQGRGNRVEGDWRQWRGENRDGAAAFTPPASWPEHLTLKWKTDIGIGYAVPLLVGNRVYTFSRVGEDEVLRALDAATGKPVWETKYAAAFTPNPSATSRHGTGPKSTPTFADGRIYTLGMSGIVTAFDAASGKQLWQKPRPAVETLYHTAMSPLVDRGLVIVHVGGHNNGALTAFDARTGEVKWTWTGDGPGYGSPMVADLAGTRQVITLTQDNLVGVSAATGELLWKREFKVPATRNSFTPILYKQTVIISSLAKPVTGFRVVNNGGQYTTEDVWTNAELSMDMSTGVIAGDTLFGFSTRNRGQLFAADAATGKTLWLSEPRFAENAAVVRAGDLLFALKNDAELAVVRANPNAFEVLKTYKVADSETWAQPVLSGQRVFIKDLSSVALWTIN